ncbi:hypothetical protein [Noviherbaspirillum sp.]|jgi:hypothetical protein|uniref:hypothetical protein n=1 Tax=Noviherbaspirillum sp. TaxID=1926288 RepID=UPI002DDDB09E|nr:hypothetical protein [Noviherbaspirillum sp.]
MAALLRPDVREDTCGRTAMCLKAMVFQRTYWPLGEFSGTLNPARHAQLRAAFFSMQAKRFIKAGDKNHDSI